MRLIDAWGNVVLAAGSAVSVSASSAINQPVVLENAVAKIDESGLATFGDLLMRGDAGNFLLTFSFGEAKSATANVELRAGYVANVVYLAHQDYVMSGRLFDIPTKLMMVDADGRVAKNSPVRVFGRCGTEGDFVEVTSDLNGVATFPAFKVSQTGIPRCTYVYVNERGEARSVSRIVYVGDKSDQRASISRAPSTTAVNDIPLAVQPEVSIEDSFGNRLSAGVKVTATIVSQPGVLARLVNATAMTNASGIASFTSLAIIGTAGTYRLGFSYDGGTPLRSTSVQLSAGAGVDFVVVRNPSDVLNGSIFGFEPILQIIDSGGNPTSGAFTLRMSNPGTTTITASPDTSGRFVPGVRNGKGIILRGTAGEITPTYSLIDVSGDVVAEKTGASFRLWPGHFASANLVIPQRVASGTRIPEFDLLDEDGNVINEGALVSVGMSWHEKAGTVRWFSGQTAQTVEFGHVTFGDGAFINGTAGAELTVLLRWYRWGNPGEFEDVAEFPVTVTTDAKVGDVGPSGGTIVYKSSSPLDAEPGISDGGRFLELAPLSWTRLAQPQRLANFIPRNFTTDTSLGAGASNTAKLIVAGRDPEGAAPVVAGAVIGYKDDWFLPSIVELMAIGLGRAPWGSSGYGPIDNDTQLWSSSIGSNGSQTTVQRYKAVSRQSIAQSVTVSGTGASLGDQLYTVMPMRAFG